MYNVYQSEQMLIFLASLGVGFLLGILYDFLRAVRLSFTRGKIAVIIFDLLYFFMVAFVSYIFILASNKGEVRSYIIIGELLGAVFYYFSLGFALMKLTDKFVSILKSFFPSLKQQRTSCTEGPPTLFFICRVSSGKRPAGSRPGRPRSVPRREEYSYHHPLPRL